jgi:hypothetical protein
MTNTLLSGAVGAAAYLDDRILPPVVTLMLCIGVLG